MSTAKTDLPFLKTDLSKSIAGFLAALLVGALIPRTIQFLVRKVVVKSIREFLLIAIAGWLTERVVRLIVESNNAAPSK